MEPHIDSYILHIRSKDCLQLTPGFNSHILVETTPIERKVGHHFEISLSSAEIPYTWYAVSTHLKSNQIESVAVSSQATANLVLSDGNYDIFELVDLITAD